MNRPLSSSSSRRENPQAFTLVELLVVIGIIALLISMLLPAVTKARAQANKVACMSNLRQIGQAMLIYADEHDGFLFPGSMGWDPAHVQPYNAIVSAQLGGGIPDPLPTTPTAWTINTWPVLVLGKWDAPVLMCPNDPNGYGRHSYVVNAHMAEYNIKYSTKLPNGRTPDTVILLGEKVTTVFDYYMDNGYDPATNRFSDDFFRVVEKYRHGIQLGSNYLKLDLHVDTLPPDQAQNAVDPWDIPGGTTTTMPAS